MLTNRTMDPKQETILVASANSALATTGNLIDGANNLVNLSDGQLGLVCAAHGETLPYHDFVAAAETVADARFVQFVQGTSNSSNMAAPGNDPSAIPSYVASHVIDGLAPTTFTAQIAAYPRLNAWTLGDDAGGTGEINVVDEAQYLMHIGFTGVRNDREFAVSGIETYTVSYTTPDYTTLGTTDGLDHLVSHLVYNTNLNSAALNNSNPFTGRGQKQVVALAINFSGGAGTAGSTSTSKQVGEIISKTVTSIPVMVRDGVTLSLPVTDQVAGAFAALVANNANIANGSTIETVNLATAGSAANREGIIFIGTDHNSAIVKDTEDRVKTRLHIGLEYNFNSPSVSLTEDSTPFEGQGQGSRWKLRWDDRAGLNIYTQQNRPVGEDYIVPPSFIDETAYYNAFIIENVRQYDVAYSHKSILPKRVIILVENASIGVGLANAVTSLNAVVQPWLASANLENKVLDSGASPAFFV